MNLKSRSVDLCIPAIFAVEQERIAATLRAECESSLERCLHSIKTGQGQIAPYLELAEVHCRLDQYPEARRVLEKGLCRFESDATPYWALISLLLDCNRPRDAIALADEAECRLPNRSGFSILGSFFLPRLYDSTAEIDHFRARFQAGLERCTELRLETGDEKEKALEVVSRLSSFWLGYQGRNDIELQKTYGRFVHRVMASCYPQWNLAHRAERKTKEGRIHIGFVSAHFKCHTVSKLFKNWLKMLNPNRFEVYCYHLGDVADSTTDEIKRTVGRFASGFPTFEALARQVRRDSLHILVYTDIGMDRWTTMLAALRLAPVQCLSWGHPVTSGLPTLDYFLSGAAMEPENAQEHYSENLILLPNLGISYSKPVIPAQLLSHTRSDFGLREESIVYLCCQSTSKYLPQFDGIFVAIARRLPNAQFAFIVPNDPLKTSFKARLQRAFAAGGMDVDEYCVFIPKLNQLDYWNLNLLADCFLDTPAWSGGNTTLEAIACDLPVVTWPQELMRSRHSSAILELLGTTATIAHTESEFIDVAVRIGASRAWREDLNALMRQSAQRLFSDPDCVPALESFLEEAVKINLAPRSSQ